MLNNICPDKRLAANLSPNDIFLAKYEINSIKDNRVNIPKLEPFGTNREKKLKCVKKHLIMLHLIRL